MPRARAVVTAVVSLSLLGAFAVTSGRADTHTGQTSQAIPAIPAPLRSVMPAGYREVARRAVSLDGSPAQLVRFERTDGRNARLGGEHFSAVIAPNGRLKGFVRMDLDLLGGALPSTEDAEAAAVSFLRAAAPDLLPTMRITGTARHSEPLQVNRNGQAQTQQLSGMRVKMYNDADGSWMWVVVGADRQVMLFERDLLWHWYRGGRTTEKWLYDSWVADEGHAVRPS